MRAIRAREALYVQPLVNWRNIPITLIDARRPVGLKPLMLGVYGYMRPLLFITALLSFSVLCIDTKIAAQRTTIAEPPFVSDHDRPVGFVKAVYPAPALKAGVEGVVNLEVLVGKDGRVENAKVMNGPTPLRQAAIDAVKQWAWEPFLLNSGAIRFRTRVTLRFDLHKKTASQE